MITVQNALSFFAIFFSALLTGLLYGYSCSVNPGLGKLPDTMYLEAMQSINREILNPWFFASFIGTLILLPAAAWHSYVHAPKISFLLITAAALVYIIGVFGITAAGNVPLNESLAKFNISMANQVSISAQRKLFEARWNNYHTLRTLCAILTLILTIVSALTIQSAKCK